jgi:formylglycine-generating enzyme required for sulfatase activity
MPTGMVYVAGGTFQMGKDLGTAATVDVEPVHTVTLTGFYMGKYEVTQAQYQAVMGKTIIELVRY